MGKPDKTDEVEIERNNLMNKRFEDLSDDEKLQVVDAVLDDEGKVLLYADHHVLCETLSIGRSSGRKSDDSLYISA